MGHLGALSGCFFEPRAMSQKSWRFFGSLMFARENNSANNKAMSTTIELNKLDDEALALLPKVDVTYTYVKEPFSLTATIQLGLLSIDFSLSQTDLVLLMQEHKLKAFGRRERFKKEYHMTTTPVKQKNGDFQSYRIQLLIVPGFMTSKYLSKKQRAYVERDRNIRAMFHELVKPVESATA